MPSTPANSMQSDELSLERSPTLPPSEEPGFEAGLDAALNDLRGSGRLGDKTDALCTWLRAVLVGGDQPVTLGHLERLASLHGKKCFYCFLKSPKGGSHGIDRVYHCSGFSASNCVACCAGCAAVKGAMPPGYFWHIISLVAGKHKRPKKLLPAPTTITRDADPKKYDGFASPSFDEFEVCTMCGRSETALAADRIKFGGPLVWSFMMVDGTTAGSAARGKFEDLLSCWLCVSLKQCGIPLPTLLSHMHRLREANFTKRLDAELGPNAALVCAAEDVLGLYAARPEPTQSPSAGEPDLRLAVYGFFGMQGVRGTRRLLAAKYESLAEAERACAFPMTLAEVMQCARIMYQDYEVVVIDDPAKFDALVVLPDIEAAFLSKPAVRNAPPRSSPVCTCVGCEARFVLRNIKSGLHGFFNASVIGIVDRFRDVHKRVEDASGKTLKPPIPVLKVKTADDPDVPPPAHRPFIPPPPPPPTGVPPPRMRNMWRRLDEVEAGSEAAAQVFAEAAAADATDATSAEKRTECDALIEDAHEQILQLSLCITKNLDDKDRFIDMTFPIVLAHQRLEATRDEIARKIAAHHAALEPRDLAARIKDCLRQLPASVSLELVAGAGTSEDVLAECALKLAEKLRELGARYPKSQIALAGLEELIQLPAGPERAQRLAKLMDLVRVARKRKVLPRR
ncbi:hypothetical protein H9P43_005264 [Blastocladiella emersonii ATCC 22665]|nr:hypothetical protein H9P43_005264 [Blastocladiella emersonii ATCC 22665]